MTCHVRVETSMANIPDVHVLGRQGGCLRSSSMDFLYPATTAFRDRFPPSGIVMVKLNQHPNDTFFWPGRILSFSDYDVFYKHVKRNDRPSKKVFL